MNQDCSTTEPCGGLSLSVVVNEMCMYKLKLGRLSRYTARSNILNFPCVSPLPFDYFRMDKWKHVEAMCREAIKVKLRSHAETITDEMLGNSQNFNCLHASLDKSRPAK